MAVDQAKLLVRILEIASRLNATVDLEVYLQSILSTAIETTGSETASLLKYDEAAREFYVASPQNNARRVPLDGSAAGWVFQNVKPLALDDTTKEQYNVKIDAPGPFSARSFLGAPLIVRGRAVGVLEAFDKTERYADEDVLVLETLAAFAATAMQNDMLERNAHSSQNEARELDRLKNEFIAITSHELRTPLGLILGHSTFLRELVGDEYKEQVDAIIRNASKLKEIIESLSNMDNHQTGGASLRSFQISVARIVEDVAASFQDMALQKGVTLSVELERDQDLLADVDGSKIAIVLSNLVKNAIAFTSAGGRVILRGERQSEFVKVSVEDNGVGVPAKDLALVFDRFYQVESHLTRKHGGMGLGLSVAKAMIEMHGGRIWLESEEGAGSKFIFLLPVEAQGNATQSAQPFTG